MVDSVRLKEIINNFSNKRIAVVGDMMLDEYIIGKVERISPEAPVPVVNVQSESFVLGGAANVINNLSCLGAKVDAFGVIGSDENGEKMEKELSKRGINLEGLVTDMLRPTIVKKRILANNQQLLRLDWENPLKIVSYVEDELLQTFTKNIEKFDAVILSDYDKGVLTERISKEIIKICNKYNKIVMVDPKPKNSGNYVGATSMTPNTKEAMECMRGYAIESESDFVNMGETLKSKLGLKNLLITRSEKGMTLFEEGIVESIPTFAREVFDVTGAGDTVISVFTLAAASGASFYEAAKIANTAAGVVVAKVGTATASKDEIFEFYNELYK